MRENRYRSHPGARCIPTLNEESRCNARRLLHSTSFKQGVSIPYAGSWVISICTFMSWVCDDETIKALSLTIDNKHQKHLHINCLSANLEMLLDVQIINQCICFIDLIGCGIGTLLPSLIKKLYIRITPGWITYANVLEYALECLRKMVSIFPCHSLIAQESMAWKELTRKTRGGRKGENNVYI